MIDSAAEALARRILVAFPPSTPRTRADVERVPVPVGRLLHAELDARADRFASLPATEWIDADADGLSEARAGWREAVRAAARFPADVWEETVAHASRLAVSHLVRPAETAAADAFADADGLAELPVGAALARVRIFGAYGYLPEIATRYAERKGVRAIDRPGLERLLRRIDRRMVEDFGPDEWTVLAGPLYDLVGAPGGTVDVGLLRALFEAKGRHEIARTMVSDAYTREALHAHLVAVMPRPEPAARAVPPPEPPAPAALASQAAPPFVPELPHAPELEQMALTPPDAPDTEAEGSASPVAPAEPAPAGLERPEPEQTEALAPESPAPAAPAPDADAEIPDAPNAAAEIPDAPPPLALGDAQAPAAGLVPPPVAALSGRLKESPLTPDRSLDAPKPPAASAARQSDVPSAPSAPAADAPPADGPPADAPEPLWKRMLQRPDGVPSERPLAATADPDQPTPSDAPTIPAFAEPAPSAPGAEALPPEDAAREPLWRRFAAPGPSAPPEPDDEDGWAVAPTLAASPAMPLDAPLPPPRTLADRFVRPDALPAAGEAPAPTSLEALEAAVLGPGPADRREGFVAALFDGSADDYHATLESLAEAPTWTAATQVIASEVFRKHRVNIYSEAALAFTDAVETQINARAGGLR